MSEQLPTKETSDESTEPPVSESTEPPVPESTEPPVPESTEPPKLKTEPEAESKDQQGQDDAPVEPSDDPPPQGTRPLSSDSLGALPPLPVGDAGRSAPPTCGTDRTALSQPGVTSSVGGTKPPAKSLAGQVLDDRYEVTRQLGEGAMGVVYEVCHLRLQKRFAMKVIHGELAQVPEFIARFEREALACSRMDHVNTISVTDFGHAATGELFLVMEFVEGQSIEELVRKGPLPVGRALETTRQVLFALQHAHAAGVIHRDIKPENIMRVESEDGSWRVKVLDFGIAKAPTTGDGGQLTQAGVIFGTPQYMAPEQAMSATVDARADLYAVGATLWRMLTGEPLFDGEGPVEILTAKLSKPPPSLEDEAPGTYSPKLVAFLNHALKRKPSERFTTADEMLEDLVQVQGELGGGLAIKPRGGKLTQVVVHGSRLARRTSKLYRDWYHCVGQPGTPDWKTRLRTLVTTRQGGIAAGLAALALLILFGVPMLQLASIPSPEVDPTLAGGVTDPPDHRNSWLRRLMPGSTTKKANDEPPAKPQVVPAAAMKRLISVRMLMERGACREASVDLMNLVREQPKLAEAHYLLGAASYCRGRHTSALSSYSEAIKLDPRYRKDVRILQHARALMGRRRTREPAIAFIGTHLGKAALPLLIKVASSKNMKARRMAITMVAKHGAASKIDWVTSLSWDLKQLPTCEERCKVAERLHQLGDPRALKALRKARDASVRVRVFSRAWKNSCCRDRLIAIIKGLLAKKK